jgi:hypothetical protein
MHNRNVDQTLVDEAVNLMNKPFSNGKDEASAITQKK